MEHWSQTAQQSANQSMGTGATDAAVRECIDRSWEPLADITPLPHWETRLEIPEDDQSGTAAPANAS